MEPNEPAVTRRQPRRVRAAAAGSPSRRAIALFTRIGAAVLLVAAAATLIAGPDDPARDELVSDLGPAGPAGPGGTPAPDATTAVPGSPGGRPSTGSSSPPAEGGDGAPAPTSPPPRPGSAPPPPAPSGPAPDGHVAVLDPTIAMMRFGSQVGLPLLCGVAISGLTNGIPDPNVAQLAGAISRTCGQLSTHGVESADALSQNLAALAAANPALVPLINELATLVEDVPSGPFGGFLAHLAALIRFFA